MSLLEQVVRKISFWSAGVLFLLLKLVQNIFFISLIEVRVNSSSFVFEVSRNLIPYKNIQKVQKLQKILVHFKLFEHKF